jgi:hypothetical protein
MAKKEISEPIYAKDGSGRIVGTRWPAQNGRGARVIIAASEVDFSVSPKWQARLKALDDYQRPLPSWFRF